jgi:hypothetical protein
VNCDHSYSLVGTREFATATNIVETTVFVARTAREYGLRPSRLAWWSSPLAWIEEGGERGGAAAAFASFGLDVPSGDDIDHRRTSSDYTRR